MSATDQDFAIAMTAMQAARIEDLQPEQIERDRLASDEFLARVERERRQKSAGCQHARDVAVLSFEI